MAGAGNPSQSQNVFQGSANALNSATQAAQRSASFRPTTVRAQSYNPMMVDTEFGYTPDSVAAQQAVGGIQTYMNPYTDSVINASMGDLERQRQMQMNQMGAQASAAGAFGGSREGVAQALTNEGFARQGGLLSSGLRQQGFNTALGASQFDVSNNMQADLANQAARARAEEFGQGTTFQAQQANQAAQAAADQFNKSQALKARLANQAAAAQAAQIRAQAASQLGNLSQVGFNQGSAIQDRQARAGAMQQALNQARIDRARSQYQGFTGAPAASLGLPMAAVGAGDMGQSTTVQSQNPGLFSYLAMGSSLLGGG